jgi:hypothetical protein
MSKRMGREKKITASSVNEKMFIIIDIVKY